MFFALDAANYAEGRYKLKEVPATERNKFFGGKFRVSSAGALKFALKLIDEVAKENSLVERKVPLSPVSAKDFPSDSFQNLLARGLIRLLKGGRPYVSSAGIPVALAGGGEEEGFPAVSPEEISQSGLDDAYFDTLSTSAALTGRHDEYAEIIKAIDGGNPKLKFTKKDVLSRIDEKWITVVEDRLQSLDEVIRNPSHFIEENEEILPIERTKKVTPRSLLHLSQHTGLISRIEGDTVIPSKLLNIFRDDSVMTYENKFVNTLLTRLYEFVAMRYETAKDGADREVTRLEAEGKLDFDDVSGSFTAQLEISVPKKEGGKNYARSSDLYSRAKKLYEIVGDYRQTEFSRLMGNAFIRPPVMRTNAILKNKNMRQCLVLWEFIEGYEDEGGLTAEQIEREIEAEYRRQIIRSVAEQYLAFRRNALEDNKMEKAAESAEEVPTPIPAKSVTVSAEAEENEDLWAIEAAIAADVRLDETDREEREKRRLEKLAEEAAKAEEAEKKKEAPKSVVDDQPVVMPDKAKKKFDDEKGEKTPENAEEEEYETDEFGRIITYRKSLTAKLSLSDDQVKEYYTGIYNKFVSREKVRARMSYGHVTFSYRGKPLAIMTIIGKTLRVYLALEPATVEAKYNATDCSDIKKYASTPTMIKVKSNRGYGYALELAERVLAEIAEAKSPVYISPEDYPKRKIEELIAEGLAQKEVRSRGEGGNFVLGGKIERMRLAETTPDADLSADYLKAAKKAIAAEKKVEGKTLSLDGVVKSGEVYRVLRETEDQLEKERLDKLSEEYKVKKPEMVKGGGGDVLIAREEAELSSPIITALPEKEEPAPAPKREVQMGGDALLPKPITADDIGKTEQHRSKRDAEEKEENNSEKRGLFSRLLRRDKKPRK